MARHTVYHYQPPEVQPLPKRKHLRLKRMKAVELPNFQLTPRDSEIVEAVYTYRALSTPQIDALFFSGQHTARQRRQPSSRCQHRLKLLFHAGFLRRKEQAQVLSDGRKPLVYFLDRHGAMYLAELAGCTVPELDWDRQEHEVGLQFLDHLLLSNDIRVAVTLAARTRGYTLMDWRDERTLRRDHHTEQIAIASEGGKQQVRLVPDGFFSLETQSAKYHQFLEVDRATSTLHAGHTGKRDWARKVAAYLAYFRSGAYQQRYHVRSFRILTVTTSHKRLQHLKQVTEEAGGKARFWFTTADKITGASILTEPIWQVASRSDEPFSFVR